LVLAPVDKVITTKEALVAVTDTMAGLLSALHSSCMDKCRVCVSTMYMPRAPEGAGCVVVIMVVTVEIIRPIT
jgi:hypothetical protein